MYCSSCGVAVAQNLTYCNFCGAKLSAEKDDPLVKTTELRYDSVIMVMMVALFVFGMVAIGFLLGIMKAVLRFDFGPLVAFAMLSFLVMIALEGVLMSRLFRRKRKAEDLLNNSSPTHVTKELEAQSR